MMTQQTLRICAPVLVLDDLSPWLAAPAFLCSSLLVTCRRMAQGDEDSSQHKGI